MDHFAAGATVGSPSRVGMMIKLTRLDGEAFVLNAELIRYVESRPDTFITLTSGERLLVREPMDEVLRLAIEYQRAKHLLPSPSARSICREESERKDAIVPPRRRSVPSPTADRLSPEATDGG